MLGFHGGGGLFDTLLQPLVAIVLLWVMLKLPVALARVAMLGGGALSGGFVARAASYAAGAGLRDTARQQLSHMTGTGSGRASGAGSAEGDSRTAGRLRGAATVAGAAASAGAGTAVAGAAATAPASAATGASARTGAPTGAGPTTSPATVAANGGRAYAPPATAKAQAAGRPPAGGLQTPSFREADFQAEVFEASYRQRTSPVSAEQASEALRALPESTRRAVGELVAEHGAGARGAPGLPGHR